MSTTNSFLYSLHFCIQSHYQNYNLQLYKATNINRGKIDYMHVKVRRLACIPNINQPIRRGLACCWWERKTALINTTNKVTN